MKMAEKKSALRLNVGEYLQDTRVLSLAARGAWMDLLCVMHNAPRRGTVCYSVPGYARLFGATVEQTERILKELVDSGVCNACNDFVTVVKRSCNADVTTKEKEKKRGSFSPPDGFPPHPPSLTPSLSPPKEEKEKGPPEAPEAPPKNAGRREHTYDGADRLRRKPTTRWTLYEAEALEQVNPSESEIELMAKYYTASMSPKDNIRRRDVGTLLNHWAGELDRARDFNAGTFFRDNGKANTEVLKELRERLREAKRGIDDITYEGRFICREGDRQWPRLMELKKERREIKEQIDAIIGRADEPAKVSL